MLLPSPSSFLSRRQFRVPVLAGGRSEHFVAVQLVVLTVLATRARLFDSFLFAVIVFDNAGIPVTRVIDLSMLLRCQPFACLLGGIGDVKLVV